MANWICNHVTITEGNVKISDLPIFKDEVNGVKRFDFNLVKPMPEEIPNEDYSPYQEECAVLAYLTDGFTKDPDARAKSDIDRCFKHLTEPIDLTKAEVDPAKIPAYIEKGRKLIELYDKYHAMNWYDWSCENWGTKWNSTDLVLEDNEMRFLTANGDPAPVILALSEKYPDLTFYMESDCDYIFVTYKIKAGKLLKKTEEEDYFM